LLCLFLRMPTYFNQCFYNPIKGIHFIIPQISVQVSSVVVRVSISSLNFVLVYVAIR
jgi:hypothetical protein